MVSRAVLPPVTSLWLACTWALALLTFCTLGSLLCLLIFYYVVVKMREGTLVGNQTMGLLLLLSVLLLFLSVPPAVTSKMKMSTRNTKYCRERE